MTNGWQEVPLGKVLKRTDRFEKKDELQTYRFAGTYSFARGIFAGETKEGSTFRLAKIQRIKKGDFIYCKIMAWEGAFGIAPEKVDDCVMSGAFVAYEVDQTQIDPKFLDYYFKQEPIWKTIGSQSTGTNVRRRSLHPNQFEKATISLPPLMEQHRIVTHIESLAARVNEAQRLREEADIEAGAILHSAQNQFIGSEPKPDWVSLRHYIAEIRNGKSPDCEKRPAKLDEWGVLKVGAVSFGEFDEQQNKALPLSITPNPEYEVKTGDFLMIRANTKELVGACAIVEKTRPRLLLSDKTFRFVFREDNVIDQRYLNHVLKSPTLRIQIEAQASGTSPTMKNISKEKVMELKVPCIPLDEQRRIVAYLDGLQAKVNALRGLQSQSQEELDALLPSILDKAFKGEL